MDYRHMLCLAAVLCTIVLGGCGGVDSDVPPIPTSAIVVVDAVDATDKEPLTVEAVAICGGVRGNITLAEGSVVLRDVPFGTGSPPTQPLTVTAPGYVTFSEPIQISVTVVTFFTATMEVADPSTTGTVSGTITDLETGAPVGSALVKFAHTGVGAATEVRGYTDNAGKYTIAGIPIGSSRVSVEAPNYVTETTTTNVVQDAGGGQNPPLNIALLPGSTAVDVGGIATDAFTQAPLAGVVVVLGDAPSVTTDGNGEFTITDVPVGPQPLSAVLDGYDEYRDEVDVLPGMARLRIGMTPSAPEPPPGPYNLQGQVTLLGASDNSGATVTATDTTSGKLWGTVLTPASGEYAMFLPPSEYRITVTHGASVIRRTITVQGGGRVLTGIDFVLTVQ